VSNIHAENLARLKPKKPKRSGDRWARLNTFVDITMKQLRNTESVVWVYLFRHERNGTVDSSIRQIAAATGLSVNGAHAGLRGLIDRGLVEVLKLSKHHGEPSVYRLHPESKHTNNDQ